MLGADRFFQALKQGAAQQTLGHRSTVYGRVSSYDPALHRVRVLFPSLRNEDGSPAISPWLPLGSGWVGNGFGLQIAPFGGATPQNPSAGEACVVTLLERTYGVTAAAHLIFDDLGTPPNTALGAGEAVVKHSSGTELYFKSNGDLVATVVGALTANVTGDASVTTQANATVTAAGTAAVLAPVIKLGRALTDTLYAFCTSIFETWVEGHVHSNGNGGADTGPPTTSPPAGSITSVVSGE